MNYKYAIFIYTLGDLALLAEQYPKVYLVQDRLRLRGQEFGRLGWNYTESHPHKLAFNLIDFKIDVERDMYDLKENTVHISCYRFMNDDEMELIAVSRLVSTQPSQMYFPSEKDHLEFRINKPVALEDKPGHMGYMISQMWRDSIISSALAAYFHDEKTKGQLNSVAKYLDSYIARRQLPPEAYGQILNVLKNMQGGEEFLKQNRAWKLLNGEPPVGEDVWECSRVASNSKLLNEPERKAAMLNLMFANYLIAHIKDIKKILFLSHPNLHERGFVGRYGVPHERLGEIVNLDANQKAPSPTNDACVAQVDVNNETIKILRQNYERQSHLQKCEHDEASLVSIRMGNVMMSYYLGELMDRFSPGLYERKGSLYVPRTPEIAKPSRGIVLPFPSPGE